MDAYDSKHIYKGKTPYNAVPLLTYSVKILNLCLKHYYILYFIFYILYFICYMLYFIFYISPLFFQLGISSRRIHFFVILTKIFEWFCDLFENFDFFFVEIFC